MIGNPCPRCGSDQILNDQCVKCGIVVSKYRPAQSNPTGSPVSFVATPSPTELPPAVGYSIPASVIEHQKARERSKMRTNLITGLIVLALLSAGYMTYRFFVRRASHYSGMYKNGEMLFVMKFPQTDSKWYHYHKGEPDSPLYKDVMDAFYRGTDPDEPEVVVGVWLERVGALPERFPEDMTARLQTEAEDQLLQIMVARGVDCTITTSERTRPGDTDGFRIEGDITVDDKPMKLIAVRGFHVDHGFWFLISGPQDKMNEDSAEIEGIINSISFNMSII